MMIYEKQLENIERKFKRKMKRKLKRCGVVQFPILSGMACHAFCRKSNAEYAPGHHSDK